MQADKYLAFGLFAFLGAVVAAYAVRLALMGRARFARLDRDGGSALLSVQVMELGYWVLQPVVNLLHRLGATPNGVTVFGVVPGVAAAIAAANGWFALACLMGMMSAFCDAIDGMLAKRCGGATTGGQALDSILDRVTESALFCGIALYFHAAVPLLSLCLLGLMGAYMTSYVSAKADAMGLSLPRGVMRRPERAVYVLFACAFTPIWSLWVPADAPVAMRALPVLAIVGLVGLVANLSALSRLRALLAMLGTASATAAGMRERRVSTQDLTPLSPKEIMALATADMRGAACSSCHTPGKTLTQLVRSIPRRPCRRPRTS